MKIVTVSALVFLFGISSGPTFAHSEAEKSTVLADACKAECPDAKNDRHAHRCLKAMKSDGKTIESTACVDALKAHEAAEKNLKKH
jgi:hypothetical protein